MNIVENANKYFQEKKYNCCQAVICAYCDEYGIDDSAIFKLTEGFGLGMGGLKDTCGAVTGMFMAISMHNSAGDKENPRQTKFQTYEDIRNAAADFQNECGSIFCRDLKTGESFTPCNRCVEYAAKCVEKYIANHK